MIGDHMRTERRSPEGWSSRGTGTRAAMKKLVIAMAVGAALAWAFDPDNGSRRREQVRSQLEAKGLLGSSGKTPADLSTYRPETISA
jgi:hypothetical protein